MQPDNIGARLLKAAGSTPGQPGPNYAKLFTIAHAIEEQPDYGKDNEGRAWDMIALTYTASAEIDVVKNCTAFMFTNLGDVIARVNGMVIFPSATPNTALGDSRSISAHWMDLYKGKIRLSFEQPTGGTAPLVEIVQVYYIAGIFKICQP